MKDQKPQHPTKKLCPVFGWIDKKFVDCASCGQKGDDDCPDKESK